MRLEIYLYELYSQLKAKNNFIVPEDRSAELYKKIIKVVEDHLKEQGGSIQDAGTNSTDKSKN